MNTVQFIALTRPVEGRENEYNTWYETEHIPAFLALPGFRTAQRYRFAGQGPGDKPPGDYLVIYEVNGPLEDAQAGLAQAAQSGQIQMSDLLDPDHLATWWFESIGDQQQSPD